MLVHLSLTCHSQRAIESSLAAGATSLTAQSLKTTTKKSIEFESISKTIMVDKNLKYNPETLSKLGSKAAYKMVCAPDFAVFKKGQTNGLIKILKIKKIIL